MPPSAHAATAAAPPLPPGSAPIPEGLFKAYDSEGFFDELLADKDHARAHYARFLSKLSGLSRAEFDAKRRAVDLAFLRQGITFNVYGDSQGAERIFPFDLMPRIIPAREWERIEAGLVQRITALNLYLHDIYHQQRINRRSDRNRLYYRLLGPLGRAHGCPYAGE